MASPVEDGGNPWIENVAEVFPGSGDTRVQWLTPKERENQTWIDATDYADYLAWSRESIVAYRIVD